MNFSIYQNDKNREAFIIYSFIASSNSAAIKAISIPVWRNFIKQTNYTKDTLFVLSKSPAQIKVFR